MTVLRPRLDGFCAQPRTGRTVFFSRTGTGIVTEVSPGPDWTQSTQLRSRTRLAVLEWNISEVIPALALTCTLNTHNYTYKYTFTHHWFRVRYVVATSTSKLGLARCDPCFSVRRKLFLTFGSKLSGLVPGILLAGFNHSIEWCPVRMPPHPLRQRPNGSQTRFV